MGGKSKMFDILFGATKSARSPGRLVWGEARARLSSFTVPKRWVRLGSPADVPTMATGKVDKPGLQALVRSAGERARPRSG